MDEKNAYKRNNKRKFFCFTKEGCSVIMIPIILDYS